MWTHIEGFRQLNAAEFDLLIQAPVLITLLVGTADGKLDREERNWSERLLRTRTYNKPRELNEFYRIVSNGFLEKLDAKMEELPTEVERRSQELARELTQINPVLAKLDLQIAADLYKGFVALAEETAESSGGFLRIGAISPEERQWLGLPMLTPIAAPKKQGQEEQEEW